MREQIEAYVRSLDLDAYLVGGAVRDELLGLDSKDADFLVPGLDVAGLRAALESHGRVDDLVVAGRPVGVRLYPRDSAVRTITRGGIEFAPPRKEVSTGPGRHDFEIVADPDLSVEEDMRRRDFTVNAMARHLVDGNVVDPFGGRADLERKLLRAVSPLSFAEDPLRLVRALRFVSQLGFDVDEPTLQQMRDEAGSVRLVSGERIGGGLAADGMGELSKLLLGREPARALRLARDTGVLEALIPEFAATFDGRLDEHIFAVVQKSADADDELAVRLATLFHDVGKPIDGDPLGHARVAAGIALEVMERLRYPTRLTRRVVAVVREHPFRVEDLPTSPVGARRFLAQHGDELALDLVAHRVADFAAKDRDPTPVYALKRLLEQEQSSPHRLSDLAIGGDELIAAGAAVEGPELGRVLADLLEFVVEDPSRNTHAQLLERARTLTS